MSHIHLPDGVLPVWLWLSGYALSIVLIAILWRGQPNVEPRKFALLGVMSAVMVLIALIEIPPFAYHFNLSVVAGIILGPQLAVLAALVVNIILALIGHGGVTVVGLNTLVLSAEMLVGYYVFRLVRRSLRVTTAGFISTVAGLFFGTVAGFGIIAAGSKWIDRALQSESLRAGEQFTGTHIDLSRLGLIMFGVGFIGWIAEGLLSAAILKSLQRIMPETLGGTSEE